MLVAVFSFLSFVQLYSHNWNCPSRLLPFVEKNYNPLRRYGITSISVHIKKNFEDDYIVTSYARMNQNILYKTTRSNDAYHTLETNALDVMKTLNGISPRSVPSGV